MLIITNTTSLATKRAVLYNSGQHAREWLAPSTVLYSITQLLVCNLPLVVIQSNSHYLNQVNCNKPSVQQLLNQIEFHFIPFINPDGYEFTKVNRMWRKNRRPISKGVFGVGMICSRIKSFLPHVINQFKH